MAERSPNYKEGNEGFAGGQVQEGRVTEIWRRVVAVATMVISMAEAKTGGDGGAANSMINKLENK